MGEMNKESRCPVTGSMGKVPGAGNIEPRLVANQLNLGILHQHASASNPMGSILLRQEFKA